MDQREYTLDDDDQKAQTVIFKPEPDIDDTAVLKKTLSCSYPNCSFTEALKKENEKLKLELQRSQANLDMNQCQVIQRLLDVTEVAAYSVPEKSSPEKNHKKEEYNYSKDHSDNEHSSDEKHHAKVDKHSQSRLFISLFLDFNVFVGSLRIASLPKVRIHM